jgi:chromodomain-helicase-DNA-binding protein 7
VGPIDAVNQATELELQSVDGMTDELLNAVKGLDFDSWEDFIESNAHLTIEPAVLLALQAKAAEWHRKSMPIAPLVRKGGAQSCREVGRRSKVSAVSGSKPIKRNRHRDASSSEDDDDVASASASSDSGDQRTRPKNRRLAADKDLNTSSRSKRASTVKPIYRVDEGSSGKEEEDSGSASSDEVSARGTKARQIKPRSMSSEPQKDKLVETVLARRSTKAGTGFEYMIKWKGESHRHVSWEAEEVLLACPRSKKAVHRWQDTWRDQHTMLHDDADDGDGEEEHFFDPAFCEIDRILDEETGPNGSGYLVKWCELEYEHATWERNLPERDAPHIEKFRQRETTPAEASVFKRPAKHKFTELRAEDIGPAADGRTLRAYQVIGVNWLLHCWHEQRWSILADEMGLGKTCQVVNLIRQLRSAQCRGPFLIVVPLSTVSHWQREFENWVPDINSIVFYGNAKSRDMAFNYEWNFADKSGNLISGPPYKFEVLITTYEILIKESPTLKAIEWQYLLIDEAHRLKNRNCRLLKEINDFRVHHALLLTGTPIQNNLGELWTLLNFMDPTTFDDWDRFDKKYGTMAVKQVAELQVLPVRLAMGTDPWAMPAMCEPIGGAAGGVGTVPVAAREGRCRAHFCEGRDNYWCGIDNHPEGDLQVPLFAFTCNPCI